MPNTELIGLKHDKGRRRIEVFDTGFRQSTSSWGVATRRGLKHVDEIDPVST